MLINSFYIYDIFKHILKQILELNNLYNVYTNYKYYNSGLILCISIKQFNLPPYCKFLPSIYLQIHKYVCMIKIL